MKQDGSVSVHQMKCLLIASESAEVLFHWTDSEFQQSVQEQYGASQEEGQGVSFRRAKTVYSLPFSSTFYLTVLSMLSFQLLRTVSAPSLPPSSSPAARWWTDWVTATPPSPQKTTMSTSYIR